MVQEASVPSFLELQTNLTSQRSASGLGCYLSKRSGIDIQIRISGRRMIEDIASVESDRQAPGFLNPDLLLQIGIEVPASRTVERV